MGPIFRKNINGSERGDANNFSIPFELSHELQFTVQFTICSSHMPLAPKESKKKKTTKIADKSGNNQEKNISFKLTKITYGGDRPIYRADICVFTAAWFPR